MVSAEIPRVAHKLDDRIELVGEGNRLPESYALLGVLRERARLPEDHPLGPPSFASGRVFRHPKILASVLVGRGRPRNLVEAGLGSLTLSTWHAWQNRRKWTKSINLS
jgi:hypothetical protein